MAEPDRPDSPDPATEATAATATGQEMGVGGILLADRRMELVDLETVARCVEDLRNLLEESSIAERKSFIRSFVKEIKVTREEVLLTYTMPLPPEGISEERLPVLYSVHRGGAKGTRTNPLFVN